LRPLAAAALRRLPGAGALRPAYCAISDRQAALQCAPGASAVLLCSDVNAQSCISVLVPAVMAWRPMHTYCSCAGHVVPWSNDVSSWQVAPSAPRAHCSLKLYARTAHSGTVRSCQWANPSMQAPGATKVKRRSVLCAQGLSAVVRTGGVN
jgi:hypothetical protein